MAAVSILSLTNCSAKKEIERPAETEVVATLKDSGRSATVEIKKDIAATEKVEESARVESSVETTLEQETETAEVESSEIVESGSEESQVNKMEETVNVSEEVVGSNAVDSSEETTEFVLISKPADEVRETSDPKVAATAENTNEHEKLCDVRHYKPFGSVRVQIYDNGDVYMDEEVESPNHQWDMEYVKTLSSEELEELKGIKANNDEGLEDFIEKLVK